MINVLLTKLDSNIYLDIMIHEWLDRVPSIFEIDVLFLYLSLSIFIFFLPK